MDWLISLCWALGLKWHSSQATVAPRLRWLRKRGKQTITCCLRAQKFNVTLLWSLYWSADGLMKQLYKSSLGVFITFIKAFIMCIEEEGKCILIMCFTRKLHTLLHLRASFLCQVKARSSSACHFSQCVLLRTPASRVPGCQHCRDPTTFMFARAFGF